MFFEYENLFYKITNRNHVVVINSYNREFREISDYQLLREKPLFSHTSFLYYNLMFICKTITYYVFRLFSFLLFM